LAFSRRRPPTRQIIDVNAVVSGMADLLRYTLGRNIAVETVLPPDLNPVCADPNQLENAVLNLAVNARDAMPEGGQITIETANVLADSDGSGPKVRTAVRDTGQGMTPDILPSRRAVFYDQSRRTRHRARARAGAWLRETIWRWAAYRQHTGQ